MTNIENHGVINSGSIGGDVKVVNQGDRTTTMGDTYNQKQGFQGPGMTVKDNTITFTQRWNEVGENVKFEDLTTEITRLREQLAAPPNTVEKSIAIGKVAEAEKASENKDGPKVVEFLKAGGDIVLEAAKSIASDLIVKLIKP